MSFGPKCYDREQEFALRMPVSLTRTKDGEDVYGVCFYYCAGEHGLVLSKKLELALVATIKPCHGIPQSGRK